MIRGIVVTVTLGLAGLFGYYYLSDSSEKSSQERAKDAGLHVLDTAKDTAGGAAVMTCLTGALGMDASRLLHVWYDDGRVLVYGLVPDGVDEDRIRSLLRDVPGLTSVEIVIQPRPDYVSARTDADRAAPGTTGASGPKPRP